VPAQLQHQLVHDRILEKAATHPPTHTPHHTTPHHTDELWHHALAQTGRQHEAEAGLACSMASGVIPIPT
jgi:hypothetical protein